MIGMIGIFMFGSLSKESVLSNVGDEDGHPEAQFILIIYIVVLFCHIPYIFFAHKESMLVMFDEYDRKSLSKQITQKTKELNDYERINNVSLRQSILNI